MSAQRLRADFAAHLDARPDAVASAPGRVNLIGEHVDYNGGRCLPMALALSTYAAVRLRADGLVTVRSRQEPAPWTGDVGTLGPGHAAGWAAYVTGVLWAMRERGVELPGLDVLVDGHVPVGAGLSSSAALECSVALAVGEALGQRDSEAHRRQLIEDCIRAEREVAGAPTGGMDQTVSLLARAGHALLLDTATGSTTHVRWQPEVHGLALLVVDTRASHALTDGGYADRRASCEEAARRLGVGLLSEVTDPSAALEALADDEVVARRARHVLTEIERVTSCVTALSSGDVEAFGARLTESHASLREDFEVSCAELDVAVETCLAQGALGARMTGGGFGGSAIALLPDEAVAPATEAVVREFAERGWAEPRAWRATAGGGAGVVTD
ncbi:MULTISPECIES: galactokinase [Nocardioides]|uniref:galactokinase n=1 Tax=Nocardioides TaxID=1839 RepID=UPI00032E914C|nr:MULTISPECIES: galactokinase [Nocardioides]EON24497.1 galactokinase [Nocardioides sp. CF8]